MLPEMNLDNENFEEIIDEARNMIISLYPEWTDYNYHDPGITMIELFAWIKENQQFYLNQISDDSKMKFLKLLGIRREHKCAAHTLIKLRTKEDLFMIKGMKVYAGEICFETERKKYILRQDIDFCFYLRENMVENQVGRKQMEFGHKLQYYPFGIHPQIGDCSVIGFENPLPIDQPFGIYIDIYNEYSVERNPIDGNSFLPLANIEFEYFTKKGWLAVEVSEDTTYGFLTSGFFCFSLEQEMEQIEIGETAMYAMRAVLKENNYDVPPCIADISMNIDKVIQKNTLSGYLDIPISDLVQKEGLYHIPLESFIEIEQTNDVYIKQNDLYFPVKEFEKSVNYDEGIAYITLDLDQVGKEAEEVRIVSTDFLFLTKRRIAKGNGFPYQQIDLEEEHVDYFSFEILVQDTMETNGYQHWKKVEDFGKSGSEDKHYQFHAQNGILQFGDCIHGMAPEGEIIIISYVKTLGSGGNIKKNKINRFGFETLNSIQLDNIKHAIGGRDEEVLEDSFIRARRSIKRTASAVTYEDYENYVLNTPGLMIESCKAIPNNKMKQFIQKVDETAVYIVVKPFQLEQNNRMNQQYEKNIRNYLEHYRLVGTKVLILQPEYVEFDIYVEVKLKPQYLQAEQKLKKAIEDYVARYEGEFGTTVEYSKLYGAIDRLEFVNEIRALTIDAKGNGVTRDVVGNILLAPNGVVVLREVKCLS